MSKRRPHVLIVEDNEADADLVMETLRESGADYDLHTVSDGEAALAYLQAAGGPGAAPLPDLVLLDLNLPRTDGRTVLSAVKSDERLKHIPVVVLTSSAADRDLSQSYRLHANSYVTKPVALEDFLATIHAIERFWLVTARLPSVATDEGRGRRP